MSYDDLAQSLTRTPVTMSVITLDYCGRVFGIAPCTGTGEPCYNTFHTCKSKTNYLKQTKDYEFVSIDAPLPFAGPRPYQKSVTLLPTEIGRELTVKGRLKLELHDEPDSDVDIDPYLSQRTSVQGTYFKKLLARNPNYKGRPVAVYDGFLGLAREEFIQRGLGKIETIKINKGVVSIEAVDGLKVLADIDIPPALDIKLVAAVDADFAELTLSTLEGLPDSGYVRIGDEIIGFASLDEPTNRLMVCVRGAFSTIAASHEAQEKIDCCRYYAPANPFDILESILVDDCGLTPADYDQDALHYWRDWPGGEVDFSALIVDPLSAEELFFEILDILDCSAWVGENLKITIRRNIPNEPDRVYLPIGDDAQISAKDSQTDLNDSSRITRVILFWNKSALGKDGEISSYARGDIGIDPEAESPNDFDEEIPKKIFCRWLRHGYLQEEILDSYVRDVVLRRLINQRDARPIITVSVELKDAAISTGDYMLLTTDELQTPAGLSISERYQVIKRDPKGATLQLKLQQLGANPVCFIAPDDAPDFDSATDAQREYGYIADEDGTIDNGPAYLIW